MRVLANTEAKNKRQDLNLADYLARFRGVLQPRHLNSDRTFSTPKEQRDLQTILRCLTGLLSCQPETRGELVALNLGDQAEAIDRQGNSYILGAREAAGRLGLIFAYDANHNLVLGDKGKIASDPNLTSSRQGQSEALAGIPELEKPPINTSPEPEPEIAPREEWGMILHPKASSEMMAPEDVEYNRFQGHVFADAEHCFTHQSKRQQRIDQLVTAGHLEAAALLLFGNGFTPEQTQDVIDANPQIRRNLSLLCRYGQASAVADYFASLTIEGIVGIIRGRVERVPGQIISVDVGDRKMGAVVGAKEVVDGGFMRTTGNDSLDATEVLAAAGQATDILAHLALAKPKLLTKLRAAVPQGPEGEIEFGQVLCDALRDYQAVVVRNEIQELTSAVKQLLEQGDFESASRLIFTSARTMAEFDAIFAADTLSPEEAGQVLLGLANATGEDLRDFLCEVAAYGHQHRNEKQENQLVNNILRGLATLGQGRVENIFGDMIEYMLELDNHPQRAQAYYLLNEGINPLLGDETCSVFVGALEELSGKRLSDNAVLAEFLRTGQLLPDEAPPARVAELRTIMRNANKPDVDRLKAMIRLVQLGRREEVRLHLRSSGAEYLERRVMRACLKQPLLVNSYNLDVLFSFVDYEIYHMHLNSIRKLLAGSANERTKAFLAYLQVINVGINMAKSDNAEESKRGCRILLSLRDKRLAGLFKSGT
ncbi:MAG: hypothetical protein ABIE84_01570, partial [bacterium]